MDYLCIYCYLNHYKITQLYPLAYHGYYCASPSGRHELTAPPKEFVISPATVVHYLPCPSSVLYYLPCLSSVLYYLPCLYPEISEHYSSRSAECMSKCLMILISRLHYHMI